jgi:hypothetical protein
MRSIVHPTGRWCSKRLVTRKTPFEELGGDAMITPRTTAIGASTTGTGGARNELQVQVIPSVAAGSQNAHHRSLRAEMSQVADPSRDAEFEEKTKTLDAQKPTNHRESTSKAPPN